MIDKLEDFAYTAGSVATGLILFVALQAGVWRTDGRLSYQ